MAIEPKLSHTAAMILQTIHAGQIYGFSVMEATGLPSGTVYPAMRRLEQTASSSPSGNSNRLPTLSSGLCESTTNWRAPA